MENIYTAYTKSIDGVTFHFVKHFQTFPEYKNVPPLLENYGMHPNFYKACKIARVEDKAIQEQLWDSINETAGSAEIIRMNHSRFNMYHYRIRHINFPALLSWVNVRRLLHFKGRVA